MISIYIIDDSETAVNRGYGLFGEAFYLCMAVLGSEFEMILK